MGAGRYTLARQLGQGGMGLVWLARDERLRKEVALKFIPPAVQQEPDCIEDLRRETARAQLLSHPNIVRIHDLHEFPEEPVFISMEYVAGQTLDELRRQQPNLVFRWETIQPWVGQLCGALAYAHAHGVIHRDLKPANMLVDQDGMLKLADFGIAAMVSDSMSRISVREPTSGTLAYMSPQQLLGQTPSAADDIYALGSTLYHLLTSQPPFRMGNITYQVIHITPGLMEKRLSELGLGNSIPPEVASMVMACLAKEPEQRPPSVRAMAEWIQLPPVETTPGAGLEGGTVPTGAKAQAAPAAAMNGTSEPMVQDLHPPDANEPGMPEEQICWEGGTCFAHYVPGLLYAAAWFLAWAMVRSRMDDIINLASGITTGEGKTLALELAGYSRYFCWTTYGFSCLCVWGILRRVLEFLNARICITTRRIKLKSGALSQTTSHIDLARIKDTALWQPLLGRVFNYSNIRLVATDSVADVLLWAVPDGEAKLEMIQAAMAAATTPAASRPPTVPEAAPNRPPTAVNQDAAPPETVEPGGQEERACWEGRPCFAHYVPGLLWAAAWGLVWARTASRWDGIFGLVDRMWAGEGKALALKLEGISPYFSSVAYGLAGLCIWSIVCRILKYLNAYYFITTRRIRIKMGTFSQTSSQIELARVKDIVTWQPILGRIFNYSHVRLILTGDAVADVLHAVPDGENKLELALAAARQTTPETGSGSVQPGQKNFSRPASASL
jgi:hypothetical protein